MKLLELNVFAFGGLKNEIIRIEDGINCFIKENGWGKTTLAAFIKSIFYGLSDSKNSIKENERKKYRPWNFTDKFGGSITYEKEGVIYKVTRLFGNKNSQDEFRLVDLNSAKIVSEKGEGFGEDLFGVNQFGFLSTIYHCQADFEINDGSLLTDKKCDENADYDFDRAIEAVELKAKTLKAERGEKGVIYQLQNKIYELDNKINELNLISDMVVELTKKESEYGNEVSEINAQINSLSEKMLSNVEFSRAQDKKERFDELLTEKNKVVGEIKSLDELLGYREVTVEEVNAYLDCAKDYIETKAKITNGCDKSETKTNKKTFGLLWTILAVVFAVVGVVGVFANIKLAIIGFSACIISLIICLILYFSNKKRKKDNVSDSVYVTICRKYGEKLNAFLSIFNIAKTGDFIKDLLAVLDIINKRKSLVERLKNIEVEISKLKNDALVLSSGFTKYNFAELKNEVENKREAYTLAQEKLQTTRAQILQLTQAESILPDLISERAENIEKLDDAKKEYETLKLTAQYLVKAYEEMKTKYRKPLEEKLNEYIEIICGSEYAKASIDVDLKVRIELLGKERETEYFSKGISDAINVAKRLALSDVVLGGNAPFILMDDPFYNLDEKRLAFAVGVIKEIAKSKQIIYFTCHASRKI